MPPKVTNQQSPYLHISMLNEELSLVYEYSPAPLRDQSQLAKEFDPTRTMGRGNLAAIKMEALDNGTGRIQGNNAMVYRARYEAACSRVDRNFESRDKLMKSDYLDRLYAGCENDYKRVDIEHYMPKENPEQHLRVYTPLKPDQQSPCVNPSMIDPYAGKESAYHSDGMEVDDDDDEDYMEGTSPSKKSKGVKKRASPKKAGQAAAARKQKPPTKKSPTKRSPTKKAAWANVNGADQFMIKIPIQNAGLRRRPSLIAIGNTL